MHHVVRRRRRRPERVALRQKRESPVRSQEPKMPLVPGIKSVWIIRSNKRAAYSLWESPLFIAERAHSSRGRMTFRADRIQFEDRSPGLTLLRSRIVSWSNF